MTVQNKTTTEISNLITTQLEAELNTQFRLLPKAFNRVLAKTLAGVFVLIYKYAGFIALQQFVRTASPLPVTINGRAVTPLNEWGEQLGAGPPAAAVKAELTIDITVESQGGTLPSGTPLIRSQTGVTYITIGAVQLTSSTVSATVRAVSDQAGTGGAGVIGNLEIGDTLTFSNTQADVSRTATVTGQARAGAEAEDSEIYRDRVLDRKRTPPQGGALADYRIWGEEPAGIVNVYPYRSADCPGEVDVYVEATPASSGSADGIPTSAQLQEVSDAIDFDQAGQATRRQVSALVRPFAITRTEFTTEVNGLDVADVATVQQEITTALEEYFLSREPFIEGLSLPPRKDRITASEVNGIVQDIVGAAGGIFTAAITRRAGVVVEIYTLEPGEKAKAGVPTFG